MILFDEDKHQYTVDGVQVPSVTQLVAPLGADMDEPDDALESALDAATDRGTTMHAYIAHRLAGGAAEDFELPAIYQPYAESVELFLSEHTIEPLLVETPLGFDAYAGTPDLVCEFDGVPAILDWKFVSQISKSKVGAQLNGYRQLCDKNGVYTEALYAVQFLSSGDYRLYPVAVDGSAFGACWLLYEIKTKKHPRGCIE